MAGPYAGLVRGCSGRRRCFQGNVCMLLRARIFHCHFGHCPPGVVDDPALLLARLLSFCLRLTRQLEAVEFES